MAKKKQKVLMPAGIRNKLMAAVCMLLVSSIMMVTSTYAWFTLSTAPEVKNISTTVAGNGSLEIALMPASGSLGEIRSGNASTAAGGNIAVPTANTSWGNLVTLSDASYGLDAVSLLPASLDLASPAAPLKTAVYGSDGRVATVEANTKLLTYSSSANAFEAIATGTNAYGVRAIGEVVNGEAATYGYVVDLAVRLNTTHENGTAGKLMLQTVEAQRIYSNGSNMDTMGGGSYMEFTAGAAGVNMKTLMSSIRVTFVANYGNAGAAGSTELGTAKLDVSEVADGASTQGATAKAPLYIYDTNGVATDGTLITALTKNVATQISAIVWLDGTTLKNSDVAAEAINSLIGTLNLQFTTDVELNPAKDSTLLGV